jgi:hypothetical protein
MQTAFVPVGMNAVFSLMRRFIPKKSQTIFFGGTHDQPDPLSVALCRLHLCCTRGRWSPSHQIFFLCCSRWNSSCRKSARNAIFKSPKKCARSTSCIVPLHCCARVVWKRRWVRQRTSTIRTKAFPLQAVINRIQPSRRRSITRPLAPRR